MQKYDKEKKFGHMKVQEEKEKNRDTWRSQGIKKRKDEHMKAHKKKKNDSHVLK